MTWICFTANRTKNDKRILKEKKIVYANFVIQFTPLSLQQKIWMKINGGRLVSNDQTLQCFCLLNRGEKKTYSIFCWNIQEKRSFHCHHVVTSYYQRHPRIFTVHICKHEKSPRNTCHFFCFFRKSPQLIELASIFFWTVKKLIAWSLQLTHQAFFYYHFIIEFNDVIISTNMTSFNIIDRYFWYLLYNLSLYI